jgi:hypothetical protein
VSPLAQAYRRYQVLKALVQEARDRALNSPEDPKNALLGLGEPVNPDELAAFFDQLLNRVNELGLLDVVSTFEETFQAQVSAIAASIGTPKLRPAVSVFLGRRREDRTLGTILVLLEQIIDKTALAKLPDIKDERDRIAHGKLSSQPLKVEIEETWQVLEEALLQALQQLT